MSKLQSIWEDAAKIGATVIIMMLAFWFVEGREYVTRPDVSQMIQTESPYIKDQKMVIDRLTDVGETNERLAQAIDELSKELAYLRGLREGDKD